MIDILMITFTDNWTQLAGTLEQRRVAVIFSSI